MAERRLLFARDGDRLCAVDEHTLTVMRGWEEGEPQAFKAPQGSIDLRKWRLLWAIAQVVHEALDTPDVEMAMDYILILANHVNNWVHPITGEERTAAKSFSPAFLAKQNNFEILFKRCLFQVEKHILPGIEQEDLRQRIGEIVDGRDGQRMREQKERFG